MTSPALPEAITERTLCLAVPLVDDGVLRVVGGGGVGAERHVDHVEVVGEVAVTVRVERPVEGRITTSVEPSQPNTFSAYRSTPRAPRRADPHVEVAGSALYAPVKARAVGVHAVAGGGAGHVAAVAVAVQRVGVRVRERRSPGRFAGSAS